MSANIPDHLFCDELQHYAVISDHAVQEPC